MNPTPLPDTEIFTIGTRGYLPFIRNLHASMAAAGFGDVLVVYSLDDAVHEALNADGIVSRRIRGEALPDWSDYGTVSFARTMAMKYVVALEILDQDKSALYLDGDIVVLKDFRDHLAAVSRSSNAHLIMQYEARKERYNGGCWMARPTAEVIELFRQIIRLIEHSERFECDQEILNSFARHQPELKVHALDSELFACGNQFLDSVPRSDPGFVDRSGRPFDFDSAYLLHYN